MQSFIPHLYGRRKGRPLNARKNALMRDLLPHVQIVLPEQGRLDPFALFDSKPRSLWLEVGFGGGEHLAAQAAQRPEAGFIGCEPFLNGVAGLLGHIDRMHLSNIRIYPDDARVVLDALPDACLEGCFVLYPDPWPKKRHHERRFIGSENLDRLARALKPGAGLCLATDVADLAAWMHDRVSEHAAFSIVYDESSPPENWVATRYETKGLLAGRKPRYIVGKKADDR